MVGQHQLVLLTLLGFGQQDSRGSLFLGSFRNWEQLNKRSSRGQKVEPSRLLWPQAQAHHRWGGASSPLAGGAIAFLLGTPGPKSLSN